MSPGWLTFSAMRCSLQPPTNQLSRDGPLSDNQLRQTNIAAASGCKGLVRRGFLNHRSLEISAFFDSKEDWHLSFHNLKKTQDLGITVSRIPSGGVGKNHQPHIAGF